MLVSSQNVQAEKVGLGEDLIGCWRLEGTAQIGATRGRAGWDVCFGQDRKVTASMWNREEALGRSGMYRVSADAIVVYGEPGVGWPSRMQRDLCTFALNSDGEELLLANCGFQGAWKRTCRQVVTAWNEIVYCAR